MKPSHDFRDFHEERGVVAVMLYDVVVHVHKDPEERERERKNE